MFPAPGKLDKATNTLDLVVKNFLSVQRVSASTEDISLLALWLLIIPLTALDYRVYCFFLLPLKNIGYKFESSCECQLCPKTNSAIRGRRDYPQRRFLLVLCSATFL